MCLKVGRCPTSLVVYVRCGGQHFEEKWQEFPCGLCLEHLDEGNKCSSADRSDNNENYCLKQQRREKKGCNQNL